MEYVKDLSMPPAVGASKATTMFSGKALALVMVASLGLRPRALPPKKVPAEPRRRLLKSMTGPPPGPIVRMGTSRSTRSVKIRSTLVRDSASPVDLVLSSGAMSARRLS